MQERGVKGGCLTSPKILEVPKQIHNVLTSYWQEYDISYSVSSLTENHEILNSSHKFEIPASMNTEKFMDDATCQEVINLSTALASNIDRSGPLPFWESSGEVLPAENALLQNEIITV